MTRFDQTPVFENGRALPVFPYTSGKTADYDPAASAIARYCVYIETDYDMDNDGKRDLVKAFVQVPRSAAEGAYKAATLYEPRPYCSGVNADGYDHMKVMAADYLAETAKLGTEGVMDPAEGPDFYDMSQLDNQVEPRVPTDRATTMEAVLASKQEEWHFPYSGNNNAYGFASVDLYDYYLIRGFAVVLCSGFGTYGSDGFEFVGSHYERDSFKAVVEWLHGDRIAYTDRTGTTEIRADWSNGNVAMTGRSYAGTMPFAVATTGVPGLKTIVPVAGIADWYSQQNQQGAQRYWPQEILNSFLSYYCTSQYGEPGLSEEQRTKLDRFLLQMSREQLKTGCDYSDFWKDGNYTLCADQLRCSALIVHGLHDENVSTKQFEMMFHSFKNAGQTVKLLLHQGPHITPSMPPMNYGINIDGQFYDEIVNEWLCRYLYDLENGADQRAEVLVQDNQDQHVWHTLDSWETEHAVTVPCSGDTVTTLSSDWGDVTPENYDEKMCSASSALNQRYMTEALAEPLTIQGTVRVNFRAALAGGDKAASFHPTNPNDADVVSITTPTAAGKMDDIKLTFLLCDLSDEPFENIASSDPQRNIVPVHVAEGGEKALTLGGALAPLDIRDFDTVSTTYNVISRAFIDLCNPESSYDPTTAANSIELTIGEYHDYQVYLNATRYTLAPGHHLAVIVTPEDPINCLTHKDYQVALEDSSLEAIVPVTAAVSQKLSFGAGV